MVRGLTVKRKARLIAEAAFETKARNIAIMDMRRLSDVCDYFIVTSGDSTTHLRAIADNIEGRTSESGVRLWHREGVPEALWVLLDYGDVVVHIFHSQTRGFYNLEKLWHDAPRAAFPPKRTTGGERQKAKGKRTVTGRREKRPSRKRGGSFRKGKKTAG